MEGVRSFFQSSTGKFIAVMASIAALVMVFFVVRAGIRGDTPGDPNSAMYVCSETGKAFKHRNELGESIPVMSPYSGKETGYPGEACYWTASGQPKDEPTWLLLNETLGKPGPTFCPDCGRLVVPRNPVAHAGMRPPPTQQEYFVHRSALSSYSSAQAQNAR